MFIPIMTFPGYGKTTFVFDLMALLVQHPDLAYLKSRFDHIDIKENTPFLDLSPFVDAGTTEVDPKRPITKIIFWDEIQNLVSLDVLEELAQYANAAAGTPDVESKKLYVKEMIKKMNMAIDAKYPDISEFSAKRQTMLDTLWQIFGNGRAKSLGGTFREWAERIDELYESQYKVGWTKYIENKSMLEHLKVRYEKMVARKESSAFENTPLINAEISRYRQEIEQTETAIRNVELQGANSVSTNIYRAMVPQLRNFVANFPDLLKFYGVGSVEEMAQSFAKDPEESVARLNDLIEKFPTSNYRDYRRMIVIAAGNPPEFMKDLFTRGQAESGHLDADTAHRLALSSNPKITYREFRARFGATEAMQSRLRMKDWTPIPPFNTSMWLKLIERRMRQTEAEFATMTHKMTRAMPRGTMDVTLRLDDSVRDLLQQRGIDVSGGPRVTLDNCSRILRMAEVNLPQILRKLPDEHRLWASNRIEVIKELPAGDASPIPNVDSPAYQYAKMTVDGKIVLVRKWKKMGLVISYEEKTNSLLVAEDAPVPLKGRFIVIGRNSKQVFTTFEHDQIALEDLFQTRLDLGEKVQDSKLSAQAGVKQLRPIASARQ